MMKKMRDELIKLVNELTDEQVIIVKIKNNNEPSCGLNGPSILKNGNQFKIYFNMLSQFETFDSIENLVDEYLNNFDWEEEDISFNIVDINKFNELRRSTIKYDVWKKNEGIIKDKNFNAIKKELKEYGGSYVISVSREIKFLVAACANDEDYYYVFLVSKTGSEIGITLSFETCVGSFVPLKGRLKKKEYERVKDYVIREAIETLDPKTLKPGHEILKQKLEEEFKNSTEYVLFTPIYLI
jgi:hypothetical protein